MSKSKLIIDKVAKLFEQGIISYKDLNSEILTILKLKRDEFIFKMKLTSKEEMEILKNRVEILEKKINSLKKKKIKTEIKFSLSGHFEVNDLK